MDSQANDDEHTPETIISLSGNRINLIGFFLVYLFLVIKPENSQAYFASRVGLEVNPLGVYPLGRRSSSCGPAKGTPPPRTTLRII